MTLEEIVVAIDNFGSVQHSEKIRLFAWYLHVHGGLDSFESSNIRECYDRLHLAPPSGIHPFLAAMTKRRPPELLKRNDGYRLERRVRDEYDAKFGRRQITVRIESLLLDLPNQLSDQEERRFLDETLICLRNRAFRATIVMAWNLTFHHLCVHVLANRLGDFNVAWLRRFPGQHKNGARQIRGYDDFGQELKESEVLEVCKNAGIVSHEMHKILSTKLGRRNTAAHPSSVQLDQLQAEEFVDDLIRNVVLKLR